MNRIFKRFLIFSVCAFVLPVCVKADYDLSVVCTKSDNTSCPQSNGVYQVDSGETIRFNFTVTGDDIGGFQSDITLSNLTGPSNFGYNTSFWDGTRNGGFSSNRIILANDTGTGDPVFNFSVVAGATTGEATITFSNVDVSDSSGNDNVLSNKVVTLNIVASTENNENTNTGTGNSENTGNNSNTNTGENNDNNESTNTDINNNDDTTNNSDTTKTEEKKPVNPDTGVTISILGLLGLVVGGVSYSLLRKKNYFNKI